MTEVTASKERVKVEGLELQNMFILNIFYLKLYTRVKFIKYKTCAISLRFHNLYIFWECKISKYS